MTQSIDCTGMPDNSSQKPKRQYRSRKVLNGLTVKQSRFVEEYAKNGGNGTKAALVAYDTSDPNTAHMIASDNLRKSTIRAALLSALDEVKVNPRVIAHLLNNKLHSSNESIGLKAIDLTCRLMDLYPEVVVHRESKSQSASVHLSADPAISAWIATHGRYPNPGEMAAITGQDHKQIASGDIQEQPAATPNPVLECEPVPVNSDNEEDKE